MFEEKYRNANESIHPREDLLFTLQQNRAKEGLRRRKKLTAYVSAAAAVLVLAFGSYAAVGFLGGASKDAAPGELVAFSNTADSSYAEPESAMDYTTATVAGGTGTLCEAAVSYEEIYNRLTETADAGASRNGDIHFAQPNGDDANAAGSGLSIDLPAPAAPEAAVLKAEGDILYALDTNNQTLTLYRAATENTGLLSVIDLASELRLARTFFLQDGLLIVLCEETGETERVTVLLYDVSDPAAPALLRTLSQDGSYVFAYMEAGKLVTISNYYTSASILKDKPETFIPRTYNDEEEPTVLPSKDVYLPQRGDANGYTLFTVLDASAPEAFASSKAVLGAAQKAYALDGMLLLAQSTVAVTAEEELYDENGQLYTNYLSTQETALQLFTLSGSLIDYTASASCGGCPLAVAYREGLIYIALSQWEASTRSYPLVLDSNASTTSASASLLLLNGRLELVSSLENLGEGAGFSGACFTEDALVLYGEGGAVTVALFDPYGLTSGEASLESLTFTTLAPLSSDTLLGFSLEGGLKKSLVMHLLTEDTEGWKEISAYSLPADIAYTLTVSDLLVNKEERAVSFYFQGVYYMFAFDGEKGLQYLTSLEPAVDGALTSGAGLWKDGALYVFEKDALTVLNKQGQELLKLNK